MDMSEVIKELGRIKHNCNCISFDECIEGSCPYHGRRKHDDKNVFCCLFDDLGMNEPCNWEIPEEI